MSLSLRLNIVAILFSIIVLVLVVQSTLKTTVHFIQQQQYLGLELASQVIDAKIKLLETYPFIEVRPEKLPELFNVEAISDSKYLIIELYDYRSELLATNFKQQNHSLESQSLWLHTFLADLFKPIELVEMDLVVSNQFLARVILRPDREAELSDVWAESIKKLIPLFAITLLVTLLIMILISQVIRPVIDFIKSANDYTSDKTPHNFSQVRSLFGLAKQLKGIDNELKTSTNKVAHLNRRLLHLQEEERRRISAELHDELGQHLTAIRFESAAINSARNLNEMKQSAAAIDQIGREMKEIIRSMLIRLRPPELDELGLLGALNEMMADWKIRNPNSQLDFEHDFELESLHIEVQHNLYRLIQEALTNVTKHAGQAVIKVSVTLKRHQQGLCLIIRDNGLGTDLTLPSQGHGMKGMRERVESFSGEIKFKSNPGEGMTISVIMPMHNEELE
jgi:two-component system sensor histidine kinase UhpB